ncbi:metal abc transporter atpase, partial [Lasius niger]
MAFYVLLYDTFCITVPTIWIDFERSTFQIPKNSKQLTQACIKKWSPCDGWDEVKFQKSFGPYETYQNARSVEKAISDMSASDDNIIRQTQTNNTLKKRFIKKRKFYGDTSSNEDEPKKNKITMPSNYIPPTESGYVSDSASQPTNKLLTSAKSVFEGWLDVTDSYDEDSYNEELQYCNTEMQKTMPHDGCDEQENKKSSKEMPQANISVKQKKEKAAQPLSH